MVKLIYIMRINNGRLNMRFKIWLIFALFVTAFAGTLVGINPALAGAPMGFATIFIPLLAAVLLFDHIVVKSRVPMLPTITRVFHVLGMWATFMAMGSPIAALNAILLTVLAFVFVAVGLRRRRIKDEYAQFEAAMHHRYTMLNDDPDLRAARGIPAKSYSPFGRARQ